MKLKDKLEQLKKTVVDEVSEYQQTAGMSADDYAQRYGYEKILKRIRKDMFLQISQNDNKENDLEIEYISTMLQVEIITESTIIIHDAEFGQKEEYNIEVLKKLFTRDNISIELVSDDGIDYIIFQKTNTQENKKTLEDTIKSLAENKDVYLEKATNIATAGIQSAKDVTKKTLRNIADWADTNL